MVMVLSFVEFVHRLATFTVATTQNAGLLKLREYERIPYEPLTQDVLGIPVRKVVIQVVAGRNIAVLVEAAVRNTILQLRGIDTYQEFVERHRKAMAQGH